MFCKNRITLIGLKFSVATNLSWKEKESGGYTTRTEWHSSVRLGAFIPGGEESGNWTPEDPRR